MHKKNLPLLLLFMLTPLLLSSCEWFSSEENNRGDRIQMGLHKNMLLITHDTIVNGGYNDNISYSMDVDGDNVDDLEVQPIHIGSPGMGNFYHTSFLSLHQEIALSVNLTTDTTFLHVAVDTNRYYSPPHVYIHTYNTYSCKRIDDSDTIHEINENRARPILWEMDDLLNAEGTFRVDTFYLEYLDHSTGWSEDGNDTTYYTYNRNLVGCFLYPDDVIHYIGFKKTSNGREQLGWVKLGLKGFYPSVILLESAIQE